MIAFRILIAIASACPIFVWKREIRKERERRALKERLDTVIRPHEEF